MHARPPYQIIQTPRIKEMLPYLWTALIEQNPPTNYQLDKDTEYEFINKDRHYGEENMVIKFSEPVTIIDFSQGEENALNHRADLNIAFTQFLANRVKNKEYSLSPGMYKLENGEWFYVTNQIIYRPKKDFKTGEIIPRYSVVSDKVLGKGSFGEVRKVLGTLGEYESENNLALKTNKKRAIKMQFHRTPDSIEDVKEEAAIAAVASHLHSKPIVATDDDFTFLVLRKFPGKPLNKLKDEIAALSIEDKLLLTIKILQALQEQIHDREIIHRDIKPENIIVDLETMEVNYIDLGLSVKNENLADNYGPTNFIGTLPYMSAEALVNDPDSPIDKASDVSSIGLTLAEVIWGAKPRKLGFLATNDGLLQLNARAIYKAFVHGEPKAYLEKDEERGILERTEVKRTGEVKELEDLLSNIDKSDLTEETKEDIGLLFRNMIDPDKANRPSLDSAIELFDSILTAKKLANLNEEKEHKKLIETAHQQGLEAHMALRKIAKQEEYGAAKPTDGATKEIETVIISALKNIPNSPVAVQEFTRTLGVNAFANLSTKKEIRKKTSKILDSFHKQVEQLLELLKKSENELFLLKNLPLAKNEDKANRDQLIQDMQLLVDDINAVLRRHENRLAKLDDIVALNRYFRKRIEDFTANNGRLIHLDLDNRFQQNGLENVQVYRQILNHKPVDNGDALQKLKDSVLTAIQTYVNTTLTPENIKKGDRSASAKRMENIKHLVAEINNAANSKTLIDAVEKELNNIRSIFGVNFRIFGARSELYNLIRHEIKTYEKNQPSIPAAGPHGNSL